MEDYPRTLQELESLFASEEACRDYLARLRWPHGFVCSSCEGTQAWCTERGLWMCGSCGHQTSVTAGTLFQDTRPSLVTWFRAVWWVVSQKNGASALELQRVLGLGSYRTAWTWLHKLRRAMVRPSRDRLSGAVEVDETFVGGVEPGGGRRHVALELVGDPNPDGSTKELQASGCARRSNRGVVGSARLRRRCSCWRPARPRTALRQRCRRSGGSPSAVACPRSR